MSLSGRGLWIAVVLNALGFAYFFVHKRLERSDPPWLRALRGIVAQVRAQLEPVDERCGATRHNPRGGLDARRIALLTLGAPLSAHWHVYADSLETGREADAMRDILRRRGASRTAARSARRSERCSETRRITRRSISPVGSTARTLATCGSG